MASLEELLYSNKAEMAAVGGGLLVHPTSVNQAPVTSEVRHLSLSDLYEDFQASTDIGEVVKHYHFDRVKRTQTGRSYHYHGIPDVTHVPEAVRALGYIYYKGSPEDGIPEIKDPYHRIDMIMLKVLESSKAHNWPLALDEKAMIYRQVVQACFWKPKKRKRDDHRTFHERRYDARYNEILKSLMYFRETHNGADPSLRWLSRHAKAHVNTIKKVLAEIQRKENVYSLMKRPEAIPTFKPADYQKWQTQEARFQEIMERVNATNAMLDAWYKDRFSVCDTPCETPPATAGGAPSELEQPIDIRTFFFKSKPLDQDIYKLKYDQKEKGSKDTIGQPNPGNTTKNQSSSVSHPHSHTMDKIRARLALKQLQLLEGTCPSPNPTQGVPGRAAPVAPDFKFSEDEASCTKCRARVRVYISLSSGSTVPIRSLLNYNMTTAKLTGNDPAIVKEHKHPCTQGIIQFLKWD